MRCRECGEPRLVHDGVGSLVCTSCGTLADPSQAVLAHHSDGPSTSSYALPRTSKGWHLAQTKQDRDRKNTIAMNTFIGTVLARLNNPGLSPRAQAIFTQAMTKGNYRWGRRAKLTAGASIAIALREAHRSDSLRDIAFFLDDSPVSLSRAFQSVISLLDFSLALTDPAVHLPILLAFLQSVLHPDTSPLSHLPKPLLSILTSLSLHAAVSTASSLSGIVSNHSPPLPITTLPTPPTACALLILGLEAEARAPLPHLKELSRSLASRFVLSPAVVSSRYKVLYDLIEEWIRHVPWLDQFTHKGKGRGASARSRVPKRGVVAKGIKDVIQFHQEIWLSRMQSQRKVNLDLEHDPGGEDQDRDDDGDESVNTSTVTSSTKNFGPSLATSPPSKRRKIRDKTNAMRAAYQFLLDPLSPGALDAVTSHGDVSLLTHLLTCSPDELSRALGSPPTRLQLLVASRGGSTAEHIADEELFADDELEGLLRNEVERGALLPLFQLHWSDETAKEDAAVGPSKPAATETKRGAQRVDTDALARLLGVDVDGDSSTEQDPDLDHMIAYQCNFEHHSEHQKSTKDAERVGDRGVMPSDDDDGDVSAEFDDAVEDWYEEEVDP